MGLVNFYRHKFYRWRFKKYCEQNYNYDFNQVGQQFIEGSFSQQTATPSLDITLWDPKETKLKDYMQINCEDAKLESKMSLGENTYLFHFDDKRLGKQWHSGHTLGKDPSAPRGGNIPALLAGFFTTTFQSDKRTLGTATCMCQNQ